MRRVARSLVTVAVAASALRVPCCTRRLFLAPPVAAALAPAAPAAALYSVETVAAAKDSWAVADPSKASEWVPLLEAGARTLDELLKNWDAVAADGGDAVRRRLGTVGITSPLFKIRPALTAVIKARDLPDDFDAVAFAEASEDFLSDLQAAEGAAYGSIFADFSTSVGSGGLSPSATQLKKCKTYVASAARRYGALLDLLGPLRAGGQAK